MTDQLKSEIGANPQEKLKEENEILREKLEEKTKELERTTKSLDNFAYVVSHDLKGPFNSIKSIAELLKMEYADKFDEEGKQLLQFIDIKVAEMDKLLMGILLYSRVRQSEEKVESVNLNEQIQEVVKEIEWPSNVQLKINNTLPSIKIERDLVHKVFLNLLANAVTACKNKEGYIEVGSQEDGKFTRYYVKDNGIGIDSKYFDKIFNIFYTIQDKNVDETGSGVGLAIVKKIIEYKGGEIWVESISKNGATFYFTLPIKYNI